MIRIPIIAVINKVALLGILFFFNMSFYGCGGEPGEEGDLWYTVNFVSGVTSFFPAQLSGPNDTLNVEYTESFYSEDPYWSCNGIPAVYIGVYHPNGIFHWKTSDGTIYDGQANFKAKKAEGTKDGKWRFYTIHLDNNTATFTLAEEKDCEVIN